MIESRGDHNVADVFITDDFLLQTKSAVRLYHEHAAAMPIIGFIQKFRQEFEAHLNGCPCPHEQHGARNPLPVLSH